jgi:hypothetical protein
MSMDENDVFIDLAIEIGQDESSPQVESTEGE